MLQTAFAAAMLLGTTALTAVAGTTVLYVPNQYGTIGAAVAAANADTNLAHDYVISATRQNRLECRRLGRRSCRNGATVVWFARADFS
jgi:hypothetical protein